MRLPDFLKDPELNELRERMGATDLGTFRLVFGLFYQLWIVSSSHITHPIVMSARRLYLLLTQV